MNSRDRILNAVKGNQPALSALPDVPSFAPYFEDVLMQFTNVLNGIGAAVHFVKDYEGIKQLISAQFEKGLRYVTTLSALSDVADLQAAYATPHELENIELAVIKAEFGVAENGAVWFTEQELPERVLPFITQNLAVVLDRSALVATMHDAYAKIGSRNYGWASFIAGPSKTADIEQSLVLGAHGPRTMTLFLLG